MSKYVAAIDQGTTSTRCMVFDHAGKVISIDQKEHEQIFPQPGWVEHSPTEIWDRTQEVVKGALEKGSLSTLPSFSDRTAPRGFSAPRTLLCLSCRRDKRFTGRGRMLDFVRGPCAAHEKQQQKRREPRSP